MKKIILLLSCSLLLLSCTKLDFVLRWADTFALSYINDYFDLTSSEQKELKQDFNLVLKQIQKEDFPIYAIQFNQLADQIEKDHLNAETVESFLNQLEISFKKSMQKFEPLAQKVFNFQAKSGFDYFDKEFRRKQEKDSKKALNIKDLARDSRKKINRWVAETVEVLTTEQEREFTDMALQFPAPLKYQIASREALFEKFKTLRHEPEAREKLIHDFFYQWESTQTEEYLKARQEYRGKYRNWLISLSGKLSVKQKQDFVKNLRKRAAELKTFSER